MTVAFLAGFFIILLKSSVALRQIDCSLLFGLFVLPLIAAF